MWAGSVLVQNVRGDSSVTEPGHGVADDLFPVEGREFLINQVEQLAVLEDQAPARAYGNRVVESPGVVVDDEQSGVGLLQETEAQVR